MKNPISINSLLTLYGNHLTSVTLQERTAPSTSMSASLNRARMEAHVRIRSMATPARALLDFLVSPVVSNESRIRP